MSKAAQSFSVKAVLKYAATEKPRRTPLIGKRAIYKGKLEAAAPA